MAPGSTWKYQAAWKNIKYKHLVCKPAAGQTRGAYVGKHGRRPIRVSSAQSKTMKLAGTAKTFYPNGYYKRVGYQKSEVSSNSRVDALGQRVRDRFNEDLEDNPVAKRESGGIHHRTLK